MFLFNKKNRKNKKNKKNKKICNELQQIKIEPKKNEEIIELYIESKLPKH